MKNLIPEHYSLVKEHDQHFELHDERDDKRFVVAKKHLHPANQIKIMKMKKYNCGGAVKMAEGGEAPQPGTPEYQMMLENQPQAEDQRLNIGDLPQAAAKGIVNTIIPPAETPASAPVVQAESPQAAMPGAQAAVSAQPMPEAQGPGNFQAPDLKPDLPAIQPQAQAAQDPMADYPTAKGIQSSIGAIQGAYNQLGQAQAHGFEQEALAQQRTNELMQAHMAQFQSQMSQAQAQYDKIAEDVVTQKIDPNHYWTTKDAPSRTRAAIAVALGAIGGALAHQNGNVALEIINKNIDRDVEAQKMELGKKQTLLSINLQKMHSLESAEAATRAQLMAQASGQMMQIAAQTNSKTAMAQALINANQMKLNTMGLYSQALQNDMSMNIKKQLVDPRVDKSQLDPAQFVPHVVPPEQQKAVFQEIKDAQNVSKLAPEIEKAFKEAAQEQTYLRRIGGLRGEAPAMKRLKVLMLPLFENVDGTVRQAAMEEAYHDHLPAMGDLDSTIDSKHAGLMSWLHSKQAAPTAKAYGLDLQQFGTTSANPMMRMSPQERQYAQWAMQHPNEPIAKLFMQKHGMR